MFRMVLVQNISRKQRNAKKETNKIAKLIKIILLQLKRLKIEFESRKNKK